MSIGDNNIIAKLPVVNFEASGVLKNLINNLMDNKSIVPIEKPAGFKGELRPYQAKGVGWLAFLEQWGLGACLADDMGLGKCVANDTLILINGTLQKAEEIWQTYATDEIVFDGEGFWSNPKAPLSVNSIDEKTGKIVQSFVKSLYRQLVHEKLKKITLQDGSVITITQQHKLLTHQGWKNNLTEEDYICVPSKQIWRGQLQDFDLIKMLAWQIAEGYESEENGHLAISQKNVRLLEELLDTYIFLAKKYNFKANTPQIKIEQEKTPALRICSITYRHFLEEKGYIWGKRSADKSIPEFIMQSDLENVKVFLSHYFDAEGSVIPQMRSVEISTASPIIIQQLASLLRRFEIWLRISAKQKCATNGSKIYKTYYIGTFGGNSARRFLQKIGFNERVKQLKLEKICLEKNNTNVEGIPASKIVAEAVRQTQLPIRHLGINNTVYINGSQQFSQTSLKQVIQSIDSIITGNAEQEYRKLKLSKWTNNTLEAYLNIDNIYLQNTKNELENLLNQEVFYCAIKKIEQIDYTGWVYDLEVSEYHNFVANNILCHNTIQTIAFLLNLKQNEMLAKPTLLICPTSVVNNWEREVHKFAPTLSTIIHQGNQRKKGKAFLREIKDKTLVITSYPLIYRDAETLAQVEWQGIVLDEAQNIKNPQAKQSQAVRNLKAGFHIALTGTPVENRLAELWSILDFLNPGFLGSQSFFQRRFAIPIEKYGDRESLKTLRSLVRPFILRRLKTDQEIIQDLPEKQEMNIFCGLSEEQANLYQTLVDQSLIEIEEKSGIQRRGLILSLLVKLKQICNHPSHFLKEDQVNTAQRSGKMLRLVEMLEELLAEGDRALIFTQFAEWGKLMQTYLTKTLGQETLFLYGQIPQKQRQEMIDRFQNDPNGPPIFILSLKAGGTGLNLTRANHVFHIDRWWNPAVENQATDRAFRIGQKRNVQVHKFVCTGTLEEKINDMIESKKQLAEQTVDAGENWLTELDTDQLRNLLLLDRNAVIDE
ncbi:SNF2-related protein [Aphanothece hegewaldii]